MNLNSYFSILLHCLSEIIQRAAYLTELACIGRSAWQSQFTARSLRLLYTVTVCQGAVTHMRSHSYLYAFCLLLALGYVGGY